MNTQKNSTKGGESGQSVGWWTKTLKKLFGKQEQTKWELYIENENGKFWTHPETPLAVHETENKAAVVCGKYVLEYYKTAAEAKEEIEKCGLRHLTVKAMSSAIKLLNEGAENNGVIQLNRQPKTKTK